MVLNVPAHEVLHQRLERDLDVRLDTESTTERHEESGVACVDGLMGQAHYLRWSGRKHPGRRMKVGSDVRKGTPITRSPPEFYLL